MVRQRGEAGYKAFVHRHERKKREKKTHSQAISNPSRLCEINKNNSKKRKFRARTTSMVCRREHDPYWSRFCSFTFTFTFSCVSEMHHLQASGSESLSTSNAPLPPSYSDQTAQAISLALTANKATARPFQTSSFESPKSKWPTCLNLLLLCGPPGSATIATWV